MGKTNKKERPIAQKMIAALVGGIVVGLIFMMVRQNLINSGAEDTFSCNFSKLCRIGNTAKCQA